MGGLASSLTDKEKGAIYRECEKYLLSDLVLSKRFLFCTKDEKKWVLDYLSSGKGTVPYKLITKFDSLSIVPDCKFLGEISYQNPTGHLFIVDVNPKTLLFNKLYPPTFEKIKLNLTKDLPFKF